MTILNKFLALELFAQCNKAYGIWLFHVELFNNNTLSSLQILQSPAGDALRRISAITHENLLSQISKLHDPATFGKNSNLSIAYTVRSEHWTPQIRAKLKGLETELETFASKLRNARNKMLAHNDISTIQKDETLGTFNCGADSRYFLKLQEFVNIVHLDFIGQSAPFDNQPKLDASRLIKVLTRKSSDDANHK